MKMLFKINKFSTFYILISKCDLCNFDFSQSNRFFFIFLFFCDTMSKEDSGGSTSDSDEAVLIDYLLFFHSIKIYQKKILQIFCKSTNMLMNC